MCGIAGYYAAPTEIGSWIDQATRCAAHRGPDGSGYWVPGMTECRPIEAAAADRPPPARVGLGFRRLRILDLSRAADQPMVAGRTALVFNGEIYNFVEIRRELEAAGCTFRSSGDSEVLLKGWLEWGFDLLPRLNGMFAFGIYDAERDGLLLARDRFGEKPLFWSPWREGVAFASEVKQLARFPGSAVELDAERARSYLLSGRPYDGPSSWFRGVRQLPPASWLWIDRSGQRAGRYFDLRSAIEAVPPARTPAGWAERFADAFHDAVRLRLRSDVPVGTSLSGGVDSSAVAAEVTALGHRDYYSFTLASDDPVVDESGEARQFAQSMRSVWHEVRADPAEFATLFDRLTWHQEAPVASTSLYGQYKVMEAARARGVIVLLDGQGADEILGGYHKFYAAAVMNALRARDPRAIGLAAGFARHVGSVGVVRRHAGPYIRRLLRRVGPAASLGLESAGAQGPDPLADALTMRLADVERWSLPNLLSYADRNSMAHSVEVRLPFLDHHVATLGLAMPPEVLIRNGWTKWPLRRALAARGGAVPAWRRGKRWFGVPQNDWLRGPLRPMIEAGAAESHPAWDGIVERKRLAAFYQMWRETPRSEALDDQLFAVLSLERFLRVWFPG